MRITAVTTITIANEEEGQRRHDVMSVSVQEVVFSPDVTSSLVECCEIASARANKRVMKAVRGAEVDGYTIYA